MKRIALVFALVLWAQPALAATKAVPPWVVVQTFPAGSSSNCSLRFPSSGGPSLSVDARAPRGASTRAAVFILTNLPPYLAGKKGVVRDISVSMGSTVRSGLKGDWLRGSNDSNSRLSIAVEEKAGDVVAPLGLASSVTISFALADQEVKFSFAVEGSAAPVRAFASCLSQ